MSNHQHSGACGHEAHDHDHHHHDDDDHVVPGQGTLDFLYSKVDREHVEALNTNDAKGGIVIKPWDERMDEERYLESDADEQLILRVPFTGNVKLRSILVKSGPEDQTADSMKIYSNQTIDFDEANSMPETQKIDIPLSREPVEYTVRPAKFPAVKNLSLFFPSNHGGETTRIYFIGFKGEFSEFKKDPLLTVYELQANPADHNKIRGTDRMSSDVGG